MVFLSRSYAGDLMVRIHFLHTLVIGEKCLFCIYFFRYFLFLLFFPFSLSCGRHSVEWCLSVKLWDEAIPIPSHYYTPIPFLPSTLYRHNALLHWSAGAGNWGGLGKKKNTRRSHFILLARPKGVLKSWHGLGGGNAKISR